jgi:hypothetical protein
MRLAAGIGIVTHRPHALLFEVTLFTSVLARASERDGVLS